MSIFTDLEKRRHGSRHGGALASFEGLVARLARLAGGGGQRRTAGICGHCGAGELRVLATQRETMMGELGPSFDTVECDNAACGHSETRLRRFSATVG